MSNQSEEEPTGEGIPARPSHCHALIQYARAEWINSPSGLPVMECGVSKECILLLLQSFGSMVSVANGRCAITGNSPNDAPLSTTS